MEYKASVCCYDLQSTIIGVCYDLQSTIIGVCHNKCVSGTLTSQHITDGCRKIELVLLRVWHTKAVKGKAGKLQLKYGSLFRF